MCGGSSAEVACGVVGVVVCGGGAVTEVGCAGGDDEFASAVEDATLFREKEVGAAAACAEGDDRVTRAAVSADTICGRGAGAAAAWSEGWSADCRAACSSQLLLLVSAKRSLSLFVAFLQVT